MRYTLQDEKELKAPYSLFEEEDPIQQLAQRDAAASNVPSFEFDDTLITVPEEKALDPFSSEALQKAQESDANRKLSSGIFSALAGAAGTMTGTNPNAEFWKGLRGTGTEGVDQLKSQQGLQLQRQKFDAAKQEAAKKEASEKERKDPASAMNVRLREQLSQIPGFQVDPQMTIADAESYGFDLMKMQQAGRENALNRENEIQRQLIRSARGPKPGSTARASADEAEGGAEDSKPLTVGETAVDRAFAKDYNDYVAQGGFASLQRELSTLKEAAEQLKGMSSATGGFIGLIPKGVRDRVTPDGADLQDRVEGAIQKTLRQTLGAQFTEKEGERVIQRAYNPNLDEKINAKRLEAVIAELESKALAKDAAARHYEERGTLQGFSSQKAKTKGFAPETKIFAPEIEERIQRSMQRNNASREQVIEALKKAGKLPTQ